ncbi:MAG: DNRLRE domain-containing protein, partial [Actinomycetota bacterium]|nr:DNRLRE domain-containing protein [Actinomycetota bacterium]
MPRVRRRRLAALVVLAATGLVAATLEAGPAPVAAARNADSVADTTTTTFTPTDDTQISSSAPGTTFGANARMATCGSGATTCSADSAQEKRTLLKFTVSGLTGNVTAATLRYYAASTPVPALTVVPLADNSWTESAATWTNSNGLATGAGSFTSPAGTAQGYCEADVTAAVTGDGTYGFSIVNPDATTLRLATKESTAPVASPQLVVTTDAAAAGDPVVVAAGDISTRTKVGGNKLTSDLILSINPSYVLALGDD